MRSFPLIVAVLLLCVFFYPQAAAFSEEGLYDQAMEALYQGEVDEAYRLFERCVEEGIRTHDAYFEMGLILMERGSISSYRQALRLSDNAVQAFHEHLDEHPHDHGAWFRLAYIHEVRSEAPGIREWEEALEALEKALEISPENDFYMLHLGYVYYKMGESDKAQSVYQHILEDQPQYWEVRYYLALAYVKTGDRDLAREELRLIIENLPAETDLAQRARAELRRLGDS